MKIIHHFSSNMKIGLCGLAMISLTACATGSKTPASPAPLPTEHFAVKVQEEPDQLALAIHAEGVSIHQQVAISDFIGRWREADGGPIIIKAPADGADVDRVKAMAYAVQSQLQNLGVPSDRIQLAAYQSGDGKGPVLLVFQRLTAKGPDCSGGWGSLTSTNSNEPYKHFGCSMTANFAAQVADPRDFVSPPSLAPADNTRRQVVLGKYRDGKLTASDKDTQASGAVSSSIQQ